jgi:hypothetical protein
MSSVHDYKHLENKFVRKVGNAAVVTAKFIFGILRAIGRFITRRYTVVFVPYSEKKVYNLHISVLSVFCFLMVAAGVLGVLFWYGSSYSNNMYAMASKDGRLKDTQASLDQLRDEAALLVKEARKFESVMTDVFSALGISNNSTMSQSTTGDLTSFLGITEPPEGLLREVDDMRRISAFLSQSIDPVQEIVNLLDSTSALLTEIPSIWPVRGGGGTITMFFGPNINPIHGQYYIHRGIDISTRRSGDPVVATADGQVVTVDYTSDFGNYIIIRHKHGYYTRYAHLQSFRVKIGQHVQQNEVIGYIGDTGISTGPHLHYEVHIGSDVVDPYRYITIRSSMARQGR